MSSHYKPKIIKNDTVQVIAGNDNGKTGTVLSVNPEKRTAIVQNVNLRTHYVKQQDKEKQEGLIQKEGPIHLSNLVLLDPKTKEPTRVGRKRNSKGKLQRYAKKTGNLL